MKNTGSVLVVAGEASGDNLAAAILQNWPGQAPVFWGFGGEKMAALGVELLHHTEELATIGFWEAARNYRRLKKYLHELLAETRQRRPQMAILVDYPGFNLRLARELQQLSIPCYLVVSPQIWAWRYSRIESIRQHIAAVLCLYEFEMEIYRRENIPAFFMGHPLADQIPAPGQTKKPDSEMPALALLPGSRISEIRRHLPFLLDLAQKLHDQYPQTRFYLPTPGENIEQLVNSYPLPDYISLSRGNTRQVLSQSSAAVACSGTVTLECALSEKPFLLIYQTSTLTWLIGKQVIRLPWIGLVNIIAQKPVTREFIQHDMTLQKVYPELEKILFDQNYRQTMTGELKKIRSALGPGQAARRAAGWLAGKFSPADAF